MRLEEPKIGAIPILAVHDALYFPVLFGRMGSRSPACLCLQTSISCAFLGVILGVSGVTLFAAIAELPQELRRQPQREPGQDRGHDRREQHYRRNRIYQPRCYFVQSAHSATSQRSKARSLLLSRSFPGKSRGFPLLGGEAADRYPFTAELLLRGYGELVGPVVSGLVLARGL